MPDSTSPFDPVHLHRVRGVEDDDDVLEVRGDRVQHGPLGLIQPQVLFGEVREFRAGTAEHDERRVGILPGVRHLLGRDVLDGQLLYPVALDIAQQHIDEAVARLRDRVARLPVFIDRFEVLVIPDAAVFEAFIEVDRLRGRDRTGASPAQQEVAGSDAEDVHLFVLQRQKVPFVFEQNDALVLHLSGDGRRRFHLFVRDTVCRKGRQQCCQDQAHRQNDRQGCFSPGSAHRVVHEESSSFRSFIFPLQFDYSIFLRSSNVIFLLSQHRHFVV